MAAPPGPHPPATAQTASSFDYATYSGWQHISAKLDGDGVLLVTLNRPQQHNAFSGAMMLDLVFVFQLAHHDDRVKVVVLTGAGKSFCAGADLSSTGFGVDSSAPLEEHRDGGGQQVLAMLNCSKLIIAAINGNAVGIGLTMTLAADLRICAKGAKLGTPFVKRGIPCDAVSSHVLPRLIGWSNATKLLMTGDLVTPSSPWLKDLWHSTLPAPDVLPAALDLAHRLARENSLLSAALVKSQLWRPGRGLGGQLEAGLEEVHERDSLWLAWCAMAGDAQEGVKSFMEKRPARFQSSLAKLRQSGLWPWWKTMDVTRKRPAKL